MTSIEEQKALVIKLAKDHGWDIRTSIRNYENGIFHISWGPGDYSDSRTLFWFWSEGFDESCMGISKQKRSSKSQKCLITNLLKKVIKSS